MRTKPLAMLIVVCAAGVLADPALARSNQAVSACETAIRGELGDGHTRINRVRSVDAVASSVSGSWSTSSSR